MTFIEMITLWMLSLTGQHVDPGKGLHTMPAPTTQQQQVQRDSKKGDSKSAAGEAKGWLGGNHKKISNGL